MWTWAVHDAAEEAGRSSGECWYNAGVTAAEDGEDVRLLSVGEVLVGRIELRASE